MCGGIFMNRDSEFLTKIYQNAKMGYDSISYVSEKTDDAKMKDALLAQHSQYMDIASKATQLLSDEDEIPKDKGVMAQACLWSGVQMNTAADKSPDHIAEMMMQGNMMGVIDLSRELRRYSDAKPEVIKLGETLIETEENNIQKMKEFLS
jgi:uncharacterized protein (DUF305 family)